MDRIVKYLYDISDDMNQAHYSELMRLLNKPLKPKEHYSCYLRNDFKFKLLLDKSSPKINVSEYQFVDIMQHVYKEDIHAFKSSLRDLIPVNHSIIPGEYYHFVLPDIVCKEDRQKIHIMMWGFGIKTFSRCIDIDYSGVGKKKLSIFIKKF